MTKKVVMEDIAEQKFHNLPVHKPILGQSLTSDDPGVSGENYGNGRGVYGIGDPAGFFEGDVEVTGKGSFKGDVEVTGKGSFKGEVEVTGKGSFKGEVEVTGDITLVNAADCAEDFDISAESSAEPGTVMVLDDESKLRESFRSYDKRVAGVISGAGNYKPGLVLDKQKSQSNRKPIALLGKVFCKVDAQFGPIEVGDLLTTSPRIGHAMRVDDPLKAFGSVIGKALRPLATGQGLIPILIALQ